ncbi:multicopper oxidase domain-containing protein [Myxococcota bacterium]|nr:multicopper oxidase domain-containing protein [Myxococcota bacterium]
MRNARFRVAHLCGATLLGLSLLSPACGDKDGDGSTTGDGGAGDGGTGGDCFELADGSCVEETFHNPPELDADDEGVFRLTLAPTEVEIDGQRHCVRAYNGLFPGPTLVTPAREGSAVRQVRVDLKNDLLGHDLRSLSGGACTCTDAHGMACTPSGHDACDEGHDGHDDCTCVDEDGETCEHMFDFNVTNLHAHGSHVRPDYARGGGCVAEDGLSCRECGEDACDGDTTDDTCFLGDDVLTQVQPGAGARYRWDLDEDGTHHDGLNWYHPHIHGTTAIQTASGAAGAWIIRGPLDEVEGVAQARERVIVFHTPSVAENGFEPLADGEECTEDTLTFNDFDVLASTISPQLNMINGLRRPRMVTPPGQVERWRILNAGYLDEVWMGLFRGTDADCSGWSVTPGDVMPLTQIARDGLTLPRSYTDDYWFMSSGYRVEGLFGGEGVLQHGDTWCLVAARFLQSEGESSPTGEPISPGEAPTVEEIQEMLELGDLVAVLNVTEDAGVATETSLPTDEALAAAAPSTVVEGISAEDRCAAAAAVEDPADIDQVAVLQVGFFTADEPDPCDCANYNVNCKNFEETDRSVYPYDRDLPLDEVEHWRVAASVDGHPFHIHINPYLVCPQDNVFDPIPFPHWRDTYLVNLDRKVDLVTQNKSYTGSYVFHCHKLTHEDHGMMQVVRTCDPAVDPTCGDYGWRQCAAEDLDCAQALAATDCAIGGDTTEELLTCLAAIGGPLGVCGANSCGSDEDCGPGTSCRDWVCQPG